MRDRIANLARRVLDGERLGRLDALGLVEAARTEPHELMYWAHRVRRKNFGSAVRFCSIVAGKLGACSEDCKWCAQSSRWAAGKKVARRATAAEMVRAAREAAGNNAASIGIVNSGRRPTEQDLREVVAGVAAIRSDNLCGLEVCASLGELDGRQAAVLAAAGVTRYHHNLETSRRFFPNVVGTHGYEERIATLASARQAGMRTCCGGLFGIGETWQDRVDLALTIRDEVGPDVVPLNFLHPIPGTPLEGAERLQPMEVLAVVGIFRLILPDVDLKIAGGREYNLRDLQSWVFYAGATSCMIGGYLTTPGRDAEADLTMVRDLGLTVVKQFPCPGALDT